MSNVTIQKRGKYYQYKFETAKIDGKRKFSSKSGFRTKAEAEKARVAAQGEADAQLTRARAEAEAIAIKAKALRDNPDILQLNAIEKWDGKLPVYMTEGAVTPFVTVK